MNAPLMTDGYRTILENKIKAGAQSAATLIETLHRDVPKDQIAAATALHFSPQEKALQVHLGQDVYGISDHALQQASERADAPGAYVKELARGKEWQVELAADILNKSLSHQSGRVLARSVRGQLRGVLSDKYRRLDNRPLVDALAQEAQALGAVPVDGVATETRVALKVLLPTVVEPIPGEFLAVGAEWSNSDFGNGAHSLRAFALRVVCLNGMTRENLLREIHLGGRLSENISFSEATYRSDQRTSVLALRDMVRAALGPAGIDKMVQGIQASHQREMGSKQLAHAARAFPKADQKAIVDAFESQDVINLPAGQTAWRASNAVSWIARHVDDGEKRLDLERLAGQLV